MSIFDWADTVTAIERPPLSVILADIYGSDLAAQVMGDIATEIADLKRLATGLEPDGVWEEGYGDALHDVLQRLAGVDR